MPIIHIKSKVIIKNIIIYPKLYKYNRLLTGRKNNYTPYLHKLFKIDPSYPV